MAIPDPPKAGSPFSPLWTGGWNPKTPKINNFFIPEITLRGGYGVGWWEWGGGWALQERGGLIFFCVGPCAGVVALFSHGGSGLLWVT